MCPFGTKYKTVSNVCMQLTPNCRLFPLLSERKVNGTGTGKTLTYFITPTESLILRLSKFLPYIRITETLF
jgi:hypothetical protein